VKDRGASGYDKAFGYGVLDIGAIVKKLDSSNPAKAGLNAGQKSILVKFNAAGGKAASDNKAVFAGSKYKTLPKATKSGYKFLGWFTKKSGGKKITSGTKVSVKKSQTVYAHWKKK
jgi:uncharacterized repeat protein (TIGR02543 family)